jgi:hypothetical protein
MLPYFEVQVIAPGAPPSLLMPRGYTHRFECCDPTQSLDRVVITMPFGPTYIARLHATAD